MKDRMKKRILAVLMIAGLLCGCSGGQGTVLQGQVELTPVSVSETMSQSGYEDLVVHYIDVGQGDSTLLTCKGETMLIDAGENDKGTYVQNYLQKQGITKIDYLIGTHPHSDHIGGADVIITKFDVKHVLLPKKDTDTRTYDDVIQAMRYKSITPEHPSINDSFMLGDARVTILAPGDNDYGDELNDYSIGVLVEHGNDRFIFTGDAETDAESDIVNTGINIEADVYQAGHHGSRTSSSDKFLDAVKPSSVVISCGEDNKYGHPHAETMNKFRERGMAVYRTDEEGTIIATSTGNGITFSDPASQSWKAGEPTGSSQQVEETTMEPDVIENTETGYVLNANTKKFHLPSCESVRKMSEKNRSISNEDRSKLIEQGYSPCGICNP